VGITLGSSGSGPIVLTGTATSLTGTLPGPQILDSTATGSIAINLTGTTSGQATPSGQTSYTGGGTGTGTVNCLHVSGDNTTGTWSGSLTVNTVSGPSVPSLAANGGGNAVGTGLTT
jgi:hypothetical protein